jgi:hypothetical protein
MSFIECDNAAHDNQLERKHSCYWNEYMVHYTVSILA